MPKTSKIRLFITNVLTSQSQNAKKTHLDAFKENSVSLISLVLHAIIRLQQVVLSKLEAVPDIVLKLIILIFTDARNLFPYLKKDALVIETLLGHFHCDAFRTVTSFVIF